LSKYGFFLCDLKRIRDLLGYNVSINIAVYFRILGKNFGRRSFGQNGAGHSVAWFGHPARTLCYHNRGIGPVHDAVKRRAMLRERHTGRR